MRSTKHPAGTVYHPHQDRLGSIVVVTRQGQAAEKKLYDAYGRLVAVPNDHDTTPLSIPFGYAGARWEATAGLYQMGARWYDPELGRFIEQDPIGEAGGLNLYAYVGSSPTLWVDPTGLARESSFKGPSSAGGSRSGMRWEMNGTECSSEQAASYMRMAGRRDEGRTMRALREAERQADEEARARASTSGRLGDYPPTNSRAGATSKAGAAVPADADESAVGSGGVATACKNLQELPKTNLSDHKLKEVIRELTDKALAKTKSDPQGREYRIVVGLDSEGKIAGTLGEAFGTKDKAAIEIDWDKAAEYDDILDVHSHPPGTSGCPTRENKDENGDSYGDTYTAIWNAGELKKEVEKDYRENPNNPPLAPPMRFFSVGADGVAEFTGGRARQVVGLK